MAASVPATARGATNATAPAPVRSERRETEGESFIGSLLFPGSTVLPWWFGVAAMDEQMFEGRS